MMTYIAVDRRDPNVILKLERAGRKRVQEIELTRAEALQLADQLERAAVSPFRRSVTPVEHPAEAPGEP